MNNIGSRLPLIAPSILSADFSNLKAEVTSIEHSKADLIHIDVMDGSFVPRITFGDLVVKTLRDCTTLPLEVHLMTLNPAHLAKEMVKQGANRIIIHQEASIHLHRDLISIKNLGCQVGVAINPATPLTSIESILELCDVVLIMTVDPGWGGQKLIDFTLKKVLQTKDKLIKLNLDSHVELEVDGGVDQSTAKKCLEAGASILVTGSSFFKSTNRSQLVSDLKSA